MWLRGMACAALTATSVHAQGLLVRGVVTDSAGHPLPYAIVGLGGTDRSTLTSADGRFAFADLPAGTYAVRVRQVGYRPQTRELMAVERTGAAVADTIRLRRVVVQLADVRVLASLGCSVAELAEGSAGTLLEQLETNVDQLQQLERTSSLRSRFARVHTWRGPAGVTLRTTRDTLVEEPFASGYAPGRILFRSPDGAWRMRVPTTIDMASPAFRGVHCVRYAALDTVGGRPVHRMDFLPVDTLRTPDVRGAVWLDTATQQLVRAQFKLTNVSGLRAHINGDAISVTASYALLDDGRPIFMALLVTQAPNGARINGRRVLRITEERQFLDLVAAPPQPTPP